MCRWPVTCRRRNLKSWGRWPARWVFGRWPAARSCVPAITPKSWLPAMRNPILMPDVGDERPAVNLWFVQPGDQVYAGDRLVELLFDGATFDVSATVNGRLAEKTARPGEQPVPGQVLGWIEEED